MKVSPIGAGSSDQGTGDQLSFSGPPSPVDQQTGQTATWLIQLLNDLRNGVLTLWASGTTAQRPTDPYIGQLYWDTTLNAAVQCTAVRIPGSPGTAAQWAVLSNFASNLFRNSGMMVAQRPTQTLGLAPLIGSTDGWAAWVSAGAVSAGTIQQSNAAPIGQTGYALQVAGYTVTGAAVISIRQRIESRDAVQLQNRTGSIQFNVYQDTGAAVNCTIAVNAATAVDNFGATTNVFTSAPISVPSGTPTLLQANGVPLTITCGNGFEVVITFAVGAQTTKNIYVTEAEVHAGAFAQGYQYVEFSAEYARCQRYYCKSFSYAVAPAQNLGSTGIFSWQSTVAGANAQVSQSVQYPIRMRAAPNVVLYNGAAANAQVHDYSHGADCSASSIAAAYDWSFIILFTGAAATTVGSEVAVQWSADADTL